jgi:hypothetical protein
MRRRSSSFIVVLSALALAAAGGAAPALAVKTVSLFSPFGYLQPGTAMYDLGEVSVHGKGLTGRRAACEEFLLGRVVTNGEPTDIVTFTSATTDEYCEGQIRLESLPRIEYSASGTARLAGRFIANLTEIGCTYRLGKLSALSYSRHLQVSMVAGVATRVREQPVHGSCPLTVGASFFIYGAYDGPQMFPWQMDSRTILQ